jgi:hypothetical protein
VSGVLTKLFEALIAPQPVCAAFGILVALAVWANSGRIERFRRDFQSRRSKWSSQKNSLAAWALISILSPILAVEWLAKLITGDLDSLAIKFGPHVAAFDGAPSPSYDEAKMSAYMKNAELEITVDVGSGRASATVWTCDLTKRYVEINGDYRS